MSSKSRSLLQKKLIGILKETARLPKMTAPLSPVTDALQSRLRIPPKDTANVATFIGLILKNHDTELKNTAEGKNLEEWLVELKTPREGTSAKFKK